MRLYIIGALLCLLLYATLVRWLLRGHIARISTVLLVICLLPTGFFEVRWQIAERAGSDIVRQVSGNPAGYLHCQRFTEALLDLDNNAGHVSAARPNEAYEHYTYCQDYLGLFYGDKRSPTLAQITALHVIVHEGVHVSGDYNEASTECRAIAADVAAAVHIAPAEVTIVS